MDVYPYDPKKQRESGVGKVSQCQENQMQPKLVNCWLRMSLTFDIRSGQSVNKQVIV